MTGKSERIPSRGDILWLDLNPQLGREQAGRRPVVVVSPSSYNGRVGLALVCPVTSRMKGYPFEVAIPPGLAASGVVLCDQLKSVDWRARRATYIDILPAAVLDEVVETVRPLIED